MVHAWTPGNALGCNVNSHRHGWGGQICDHPGSWNCGATHDFRTGYCERGDGRCYHLNLFQEEDPSLVIDDHGVGWLLEPDVHALDDQLLLLWGNQFAEPRGIRESGAQRAIVFGAYRIQRVEPQTSHYRTTWRIVPHPGSWTRLNLLQVERPRYQSLGGPYIKQIDGSAVQRLFRRLEEAAQGAHDAWLSAEDRARFNSFHGGLEGWLEQARVRAESGDGGSPLFHARPGPAASARGGAPGMGYKPFKGLKAEPAPPPRGGQSAAASSAASAEATLPGAAPSKLADGELESVESPSSEPSFAGSPRAASAPTEVELHAPRVPHLAVEAQAPLPEEAARSELAQLYGESTLTALQVGSLTKPLLVLAGSPGVGKSTLAHRLIDDPEERRTLTVPVASTWRGREDLIGHVNPINNEFEPVCPS